MSPDFSVRPFAAGTVVGLRSFRPGREALQGVVRPAPWQAGENLARCYPNGRLDEPPSNDEHHRVAGLDCTCGFYAYFGDANDYSSPMFGGSVTGIIEGYGVVTLGSRGFRAAKARIVALVRPDFLDCGYPDCTCRAPYAAAVTAMLARYDVPIYDTVDQALTAHPTTKPQDVGITPPPARSDRVPTVSYGAAIFAPLSVNASAATNAMQALAAALQRSADRIRGYAAGGIVHQRRTAVPRPSNETADPVAKKKQAAQQAADRRARAGLSNLGGIDRRRRRP